MILNIVKSMAVVAVAIFTGYNVYLSHAKSDDVSSDVLIANVEALASGEGSETEKIYCCGSVGTCMIVYDSSFEKKEVVGLKFSTPCPQ